MMNLDGCVIVFFILLMLSAFVNHCYGDIEEPCVSTNKQGRDSQMFNYMGCYELDCINSTKHFSSNNYNIEDCTDFCETQGYDLAGLTQGLTCQCDFTGNFSCSSPNTLCDSDCNVTCGGNPLQVCGGIRGIQIYNISYRKNQSQLQTDKPIYNNQLKTKHVIKVICITVASLLILLSVAVLVMHYKRKHMRSRLTTMSKHPEQADRRRDLRRKTSEVNHYSSGNYDHLDYPNVAQENLLADSITENGVVHHKANDEPHARPKLDSPELNHKIAHGHSYEYRSDCNEDVLNKTPFDVSTKSDQDNEARVYFALNPSDSVA